MKRMIFTLIILAAMVGQGFTQEKLKIGDVVNGKLKITNEAALKGFFLQNLDKSGALENEVKVDASPKSDRFLVHMRVNGHKRGVNTIGVLLVNINNEAYIVNNQSDQPIGPGIGGSITYSCIGDPCDNCNIKVTWPPGSWKPDVHCECQSAGGGICNMTVTVVFEIKI